MSRLSSFSSKNQAKALIFFPGIEAEGVDLVFEGDPGHVVAIDVGAGAKLKKTNLKVVFLRV